ncbi:DUF6731 family protein [Flavobacterium piscinae]|uniref:DUF6731 family protein n=1 Tax=Flavobacterium piscinae TaxID=2506424 RepID=UPI002AAA646E|nr:DUF6731 family protein [Flavobacterium piscinae]
MIFGSIQIQEKSFNKIDFSDGEILISNIKSMHSDRYCLGTFIYNQKSNVPPKFDGVNTEPLELNHNQGLGYDCSFIFDSKTNIIGLESRRPGVNLNALTEFIHNNYDVPQFDFSMVIIPSEYQKFLDSPSYYRIEYDIAKPTNSTGIKGNSSSSLDSTIDAMDEINALKGSIIYSVGNYKTRSLNLKEIRLFVQGLLKLNKREDFVKILKITGTDIDSEKSKVFDLVANRLVENIEIEKQRINSKFFIKEKYRQLEALYLRHQPLLLKQYKI